MKFDEPSASTDSRPFEVKMTHNGRTVTISYDPSDPEAVQAAETWRKALFAPKDAPKDGNCLYVSDRVRYALDAIAYLSGNIDGRYAFIPLTDKQREAIDALYEDLHSREPFDEANLFKPGSYEPKDLPTKHNLMTELEKAAADSQHSYNFRLTTQDADSLHRRTDIVPGLPESSGLQGGRAVRFKGLEAANVV